MFPTLRPGDRVTVKPLLKGELPAPGSVIVCREKENLVMHRLIEIIEGEGGELFFITRGDSVNEKDNPWHKKQLLGVAITYRRSEKYYPVNALMPIWLHYKINRLMLWFTKKLKRLPVLFETYDH
jgi:signal peptidase I